MIIHVNKGGGGVGSTTMGGGTPPAGLLVPSIRSTSCNVCILLPSKILVTGLNNTPGAPVLLNATMYIRDKRLQTCD